MGNADQKLAKLRFLIKNFVLFCFLIINCNLVFAEEKLFDYSIDCVFDYTFITSFTPDIEEFDQIEGRQTLSIKNLRTGPMRVGEEHPVVLASDTDWMIQNRDGRFGTTLFVGDNVHVLTIFLPEPYGSDRSNF
jgi:hypothetical protein